MTAYTLVGVLAYFALHIQLYRSVRDDIVMAPESNARYLRLLRWFGPAAAVELLIFISTSKPHRP